MPKRPGLDPLHQPLPRTVVVRPRLLRRLDALGPGGLGLVIASAGSGKSVLVRQWAAARPGLGFGALALGPHHDDPVVLLRDLVAAIREAAPGVDVGVTRATVPGGRGLGDVVVESLQGVLAALPGDVALVIEDLHALTNAELVHDLGRLVCALPASTRAVVTSRRDPPWAVHTVRVEDRLVELRSADLAFGTEDGQALLVNLLGRPLTREQAGALLTRTDGWAVGLQLAAISLRDSPDLDSSIEAFAGSHRLVAEYLVGEVLDQQDPQVRRFLLQTSVLGWLSPEVCDAVTGAGNARRMLEELERRSLFLLPLDRSGGLFRYHHLFADLLLYRLRAEAPDTEADLHRRAARWLLDHGRGEEAVDHLLAAGDHAAAFDVISDVGHLLYERGEVATVLGWLRTIERAQSPCPGAVVVSLLAAQVAVDEVGVAADTYRRLLRRSDLTLGERTAAHALFTILGFRDIPPEAVTRAAAQVREALPHLGHGEVVNFLGIGGRDSVEVMAEYGAAGALFLTGDVAGAARSLDHVLSLPGTAYPVWKVYVLGLLALTRAWSGHSTEALRLAASAGAAARAAGLAHHSARLNAHLAAALAHLDRVELEAAAASLDLSRPLLSRRRASVAYFDLQAALEIRLLAAIEGTDEAFARLGDWDSSLSEAPVLRLARHAFEARLLVWTGRLAEAQALLQADPADATLAPARIDLALARADVREARRLLDGWLPREDDLRASLRHRLSSFAVLRAEGQRDPARLVLDESVALAHADQMHWPFVEVPEALQAVRRHGSRDPALVSDALWHVAQRLHPRLRAQAALPEHLTERELEVLAYLPGRMKNEEIAAELFVSVNTVKTHLRNIYAKLGVTERNDAVHRAVELGLL
ncbi:hypothetical protein GCM10023168_25150 [Fodinibacter luteus]|uniref:HTH luxR-type domain-containing protein n=1 Tax=Fodinibacter luteus TaxID=552064 RepID=A0ABP8KJU1_9MICO